MEASQSKHPRPPRMPKEEGPPRVEGGIPAAGPSPRSHGLSISYSSTRKNSCSILQPSRPPPAGWSSRVPRRPLPRSPRRAIRRSLPALDRRLASRVTGTLGALPSLAPNQSASGMAGAADTTWNCTASRPLQPELPCCTCRSAALAVCSLSSSSRVVSGPSVARNRHRVR